MHYDEQIKALLLHGGGSDRDFINIHGQDMYLVELSKASGTGKGKNSSVFRAVDPEAGDDYVIKFCQYHNQVRGEVAEEKRKRFIREIDAAKLATSLDCSKYLIGVIDDGYYRLSKACAIRYYVMEKAECDLSDFLKRADLSLQQRLYLFSCIMKAMKALHDIELYHRDLKADNIFLVDGEWKIGDLGFAEFREDDFMFDGPNQKIGPAGLMSPEATNKLLADKEHPNFGGNCDIDARSDVYQLGNIFWFIFQGDIPTGQLILSDFREKDKDIYHTILYPMLQHSKERRPTICELLECCRPIFARHGVE